MAQSATLRGKHGSLHRGGLAWRLILPVPLAVLIAVISIWATVPQLMDSMATTDAIFANKQVAAQLESIRAYYTENVVDKVVKGGAFKADVDHKGNDKVI